MARRSSSSRWSRPATGKQIAALKAHGSYDGKYYSMGRASQSIGGSARVSSSSGRGTGGGAAYSPPAWSGLAPSGIQALLLGGAADLASQLQTALGAAPQSPLATSGSGPSRLLSQLLGVPDDLDALVEVALGSADQDTADAAESDHPVESVAFTIRTDDSDPVDPQVVVEAEVIRDATFAGKPTLQVRFVGNVERDAARPPEGTRTTLGYRPRWTPTLVRTPADLAEQMRTHGGEAMAELAAGVEPRMVTFLVGAGDMDAALAVLRSNQPAAAKFVILQGLLDPSGPIQFQGLGLDAGTMAEQIRLAHDGDDEALRWLDTIRREEVLTSFAEVTGTDLAAEADFNLARWYEQGEALIAAVTTTADTEYGFAPIRMLLMSRAQADAAEAELRATIAATVPADRVEAELDRYVPRPRRSSTDYGRLEDWFFDETAAYLRARFRQSLPGQFAAALTPGWSENHGAALRDEIRAQASGASTTVGDYVAKPAPSSDSSITAIVRSIVSSPRDDTNVRRSQRIIQAVRRAITESEAARDDDLGTLIIAQEVLTYAQWKRDELRGAEQAEAVAERRRDAAKRAENAKHLEWATTQRDDDASKSVRAAQGVEKTVQKYADALKRGSRSIDLQDPLPNSVRSSASTQVEQAKRWEKAADEWLAAAKERERRAAAEIETAATPKVRELLSAERDAAIAEQAEMKAAVQAARHKHQEAQRTLELLDAARAKYAELIRPVFDENQRRRNAEAEVQRKEQERQAEERRRRDEEVRQKQAAECERQDAERRRQEAVNQRQQDRARAAKDAIAPSLTRLLALPDSASFWRRKALATDRATLEQTILQHQGEIVAPLVPPRAGATTWPAILARGDRYLGRVKKLTDYGAFVSLPAGADGLLRGADKASTLTPGQLIVVEVVDLPYGKPIALKLVTR